VCQIISTEVRRIISQATVTDKEKADYIIRSTVTQTTPSQPAVVVNNTNVNNGSSQEGGWPASRRGHGPGYPAPQLTTSSVAVIDARSSNVAFAYLADRGGLKSRHPRAHGNSFSLTAQDHGALGSMDEDLAPVSDGTFSKLCWRSLDLPLIGPTMRGEGILASCYQLCVATTSTAA
jgi:hypothetical protein